MKLKISDATGREVREISGQALANSGKAGMQSACWDLRMQPVPLATAAGGGSADVRAVAVRRRWCVRAGAADAGASRP